MLKEILNTPPRAVPTMRIYPNFLSFNAPAAALLQLEEDGSVAIMQDDRDGYLYVANCRTKQSYPLAMRNNTFLVRNVELCNKLAECLEGFGTYRISKDVTLLDYNDNKYYNIFKKKYGKDK